MDKPIAYQTDARGYYSGLAEIDPNPEAPGEWVIPGGCVDVEPPPPVDGKLRRWVDGAWTYEDEPPTPAGPQPRQPMTLDDYRAQAYQELERRAAVAPTLPFDADINGAAGPRHTYQVQGVDLLALVIAGVHAALAADPSWTYPIETLDAGSVTHSAAQVANVLGAWQTALQQRSADIKALRAQVAAAPDIAAIQALMATPQPDTGE